MSSLAFLFSLLIAPSAGPTTMVSQNTSVTTAKYDAQDPSPYVEFVFKYRSVGMH